MRAGPPIGCPRRGRNRRRIARNGPAGPPSIAELGGLDDGAGSLGVGDEALQRLPEFAPGAVAEVGRQRLGRGEAISDVRGLLEPADGAPQEKAGDHRCSTVAQIAQQRPRGFEGFVRLR